MNEVKENKGSGLKYLLFIGIPVIIILGVLGAYYYVTNPMSILTKTINTAYEKMDQLIANKTNTFDLTEDPININTNIAFKTDMDMNGLENIQNYNYDFNIGLNMKKKVMNIELGIKEDQKQIISANLYQIKNKQYLKSKQLFDKLVDITNETGTDFDDMFKIEGIDSISNVNNEDIKYVLKRYKEIIVGSLNKKYISREKTDITINDKTIKATKITYLLNKENQERTLNYIKEESKKDSKLIQILAKISDTTEEDIKTNFDNMALEDESDASIVLYTEGFDQKIVQINLIEDNENILSYTNQDNTFTVNLNNQIILKIKKLETEEIDLDYELKEQNATGTLRIKGTSKEKETQGSIYLLVNSKEFNGEINLTINLNTNPVNTVNTNNAVKINELTNEDMAKIFENLENTLKGTFFLDLIESQIM